MRQIHQMVAGFVVAIAIQAWLVAPALAQGAQPAGQAGARGGEAGGPPEAGVGGDQSAAGPAGANRPLQTPILYVTGVEVLRSSMEPKLDVIRVTGLASSAGWSSPQLVPFFYGKPLDAILDLQLIGTSPEQSQKAEGFVPVSAMFTLDAGHPYKGVRIRAGANALELKQMPGNAQTQVKSIDCKECMGKKFAEKGKAQAGAADTVREEDLPRGFRVIVPTRGVAGIVHNPNRINLILDDNNTIVMSFWE